MRVTAVSISEKKGEKKHNIPEGSIIRRPVFIPVFAR